MFTRGFVGQQAVRARIPGCTGSLLEVGRSGASRSEWIFEAVQELRTSTHMQRIGVWMEEPGAALTDGAAVFFRGEVWDEGIGNVLEWTKLAVDAPLRIQTLRVGLNCEYELREPANGGVVAPELQMRRVLWAPVMVRRALRGLLMLGTVDKKRSLPAAEAERVAESLGVLLELEDERRLASTRKADLDFCMRMKRLLLERQSANMILGQLAESCTRGEPNGGVGAVFTLIGERKPGPATAAGGTARQDHLLVRAQSGDATWVHAVNNGPLERIWRRALSNREVACTEANPLPLAKDLSRLVAIPIERTNDVAGVMLAGLPKPRATLEALDRMVLRSALAGEVFEQKQRVQKGLVERLWRKAFIESREEPVVLLDRYGGGHEQGDPRASAGTTRTICRRPRCHALRRAVPTTTLGTRAALDRQWPREWQRRQRHAGKPALWKHAGGVTAHADFRSGVCHDRHRAARPGTKHSRHGD
jgi:hypothetical protein